MAASRSDRVPRSWLRRAAAECSTRSAGDVRCASGVAGRRRVVAVDGRRRVRNGIGDGLGRELRRARSLDRPGRPYGSTISSRATGRGDRRGVLSGRVARIVDRADRTRRPPPRSTRWDREPRVQPDGASVASASTDGVARIWQRVNGGSLSQLDGPSRPCADDVAIQRRRRAGRDGEQGRNGAGRRDIEVTALTARRLFGPHGLTSARLFIGPAGSRSSPRAPTAPPGSGTRSSSRSSRSLRLDSRSRIASHRAEDGVAG